jgi:anti-sigma B factor antagonist
MDDSPDFDARVESGGGSGQMAVIVLRGELDAHAAEILGRSLESIDRASDGVVLDMSEVSFVDSSGLRTLIHARQLFGDRPRTVTIRQPQRSTARLFELTGLSDYFVVSA